MGRTGLEQTGKTLGNSGNSERSGADSGADPVNSLQIDPDLQRLIDSWPNLPEAVKAGIAAMVNASNAGLK